METWRMVSSGDSITSTSIESAYMNTKPFSVNGKWIRWLGIFFLARVFNHIHKYQAVWHRARDYTGLALTQFHSYFSPLFFSSVCDKCAFTVAPDNPDVRGFREKWIWSDLMVIECWALVEKVLFNRQMNSSTTTSAGLLMALGSGCGFYCSFMMTMEAQNRGTELVLWFLIWFLFNKIQFDATHIEEQFTKAWTMDIQCFE